MGPRGMEDYGRLPKSCDFYICCLYVEERWQCDGEPVIWRILHAGGRTALRSTDSASA